VCVCDYVGGQQANTKVNDRMKEQESRHAVQKIEARFGHSVSLLLPHRRFIMEGDFQKIERSGKPKLWYVSYFSCRVCVGVSLW